MKNFNFLRVATLGLVAVFSIGAAQAASINGSLNFGSAAAPVSVGGLDVATGLTFPEALLISSAFGDFAADGIGFGSSGTIIDFDFNPLPAPVTLITIGSFTFTLSDVQIADQTDVFLVLAGTGTLVADGFDVTAYAMSMTVNSVGGGYAMSGTLAPVPVPGALLLFMSGLAALGIRRRD